MWYLCILIWFISLSLSLSLAHRYWSCSAVRPLIREVFSIIGRPPDLQSWIFAVNLENHAITISSAAKHAIYVFFVDREMRGLKIKYPGGKNQHFRHLLFFAFHRDQKAAEAALDICKVYGKGVIGDRTAQKWSAKFKNGDLDLEDTPRSGRQSEFNEEHLKALLKEDGRQTSRELAEKIKYIAMTISNHTLRTLYQPITTFSASCQTI
ncbi:hypothetical protein LAZ67_8003154 [Cordylochernes scorpioides]|uniref:Mos1 transposase HTH domain-containing protein n=1 Tax=Cordylochernes scorpioides TaxID=51811 RepID=A0ABY6KRD2_9ARAC|nr:hypothetical protein LAZ67_8003154 [Cordylochernes scorpioides]